jgi:hypothetical protein
VNRADAEAYTEALGSIVVGGWRQAALGEKLGVPEALDLTTREWIEQRLGGYLKLTVTQRREAVEELTDDGMSRRQIAGVIGVGTDTVARDRRAVLGNTPERDDGSGDDAEIDDDALVQTVCPTCHGTGLVTLEGGQQ